MSFFRHNYPGQNVVETFGHVVSLSGSLLVSFIPILLFAIFMPETLGHRGDLAAAEDKKEIPHDYFKAA